MKKLSLLLLLIITGNVWLSGHAGNIPVYELSTFCSEPRLDFISFSDLANLKGSEGRQVKNYRSLHICNINPSGFLLTDLAGSAFLSSVNTEHRELENSLVYASVERFYQRRAPPLNS